MDLNDARNVQTASYKTFTWRSSVLGQKFTDENQASASQRVSSFGMELDKDSLASQATFLPMFQSNLRLTLCVFQVLMTTATPLYYPREFKGFLVLCGPV